MFHQIQILETLDRDKAEKAVRRLRKAGYNVSCISNGWSVYRVCTRPLDYSQAFGIYRQLQRTGYNPVMI